MRESFATFWERRKAASDAFVRGDVQPLLKISSTSEQTTLFNPRGGIVVGASAVNHANATTSARFAEAKENRFEILSWSENGNIARWAGNQYSIVRMVGSDEWVPYNLRVTEVFEYEVGGWKLIHRHADPATGH